MTVATKTIRNHVSPWALLNPKGIMHFYRLGVHASCTPGIQGEQVDWLVVIIHFVDVFRVSVHRSTDES
jgi:hypothetical protein